MEKQASNFELNILKLGKHIFQLSEGDQFQTNGGYFNYVPCAKENKNKGKRVRYSGRSNEISAKKYMKDVLRADNIELIEDKLLWIDTQGDEHRQKTWEVKYAYKIEIEKHEPIVILSLELGGKYSFQEKSDDKWIFKTEELPVERVTKENYFLSKYNPYTYKSQIPLSNMYVPHVHSNRNYYILCMMDKYHEAEETLFKYAEAEVIDKIKTAQDIVLKETENLKKFQDLKLKQGY